MDHKKGSEWEGENKMKNMTKLFEDYNELCKKKKWKKDKKGIADIVILVILLISMGAYSYFMYTDQLIYGIIAVTAVLLIVYNSLCKR